LLDVVLHIATGKRVRLGESNVYQSVTASDQHRALKVRRLREAKERIAEFSARSPVLRDPEYDDWRQAVIHLLNELFAPSSYSIRFQKLRIHAVVHNYRSGTHWGNDPDGTWHSGLEQADRLLGEAIEEAELGAPPVASLPSTPTKNSGIVVNVTNVFSPSVHITFEQVLGELNNLPLSASERAIAGEYLQELEGETKGEKRWPLIARSLEGMKALGKGVYEKVALPLLVEFLKRQIDPR
jgi:hypothetical protein